MSKEFLISVHVVCVATNISNTLRNSKVWRATKTPVKEWQGLTPFQVRRLAHVFSSHSKLRRDCSWSIVFVHLRRGS